MSRNSLYNLSEEEANQLISSLMKHFKCKTVSKLAEQMEVNPAQLRAMKNGYAPCGATFQFLTLICTGWTYIQMRQVMSRIRN
jgi:hypothetical protein